MTQSIGPSWLSKAVFYQVYPQSFCDGNADGIGDLAGLISKLDYIRSLGVNAVWLNPCFVSPFHDAGYDVADYYRVAPRYGANADLRRLFREAERRGIKVCLDLVAGHTSIEHPWFQASCRHRKNRYSDRYIWTRSAFDAGSPPLRFINGFSERDGCFAVNFFYSQPALNYGYADPDPMCPWQQPVGAPGPQATRAELRRIMRFWLDQGAAGFRVDMAHSLVKNDPGRKATIALWQEVRAWLDQAYPEAALMAEWGNPAESSRAGFHLDFMLQFGVPGYASLFHDRPGQKAFFNADGQGSILFFLDQYLTQRRKAKRACIAIPSGNHDMARISRDRSVADLKVAFAFLLTWPGPPFIYYGDEIGLRYQPNLPSKEGGYGRTGSRTPMQWDDTESAGFSQAAPDKLYLPLDPRKTRPTVARQDKDPHSLLNHVRRLTALRKTSPALQADGGLALLFAEPDAYPFIYLRRLGREAFVVALNPARRKVRAEARIPLRKALKLELGEGVRVMPGQGRAVFDLAGVSYGVYRLV
jgi:maltose alpha-D-glucosyltransferase/alpha-amylase